MTFGQWLTAYLEISFFVMAMTVYLVTEKPEFMLIGSVNMMIVAFVYMISRTFD